MHIDWVSGGIMLAVLIVIGAYVRLPKWFQISVDPWSPKLESDMYPYVFFPRWLQRLYEHNLAWRRNVSKRWQLRRQWKEGKRPYSEDDVSALRMVLGRPLD